MARFFLESACAIVIIFLVSWRMLAALAIPRLAVCLLFLDLWVVLFLLTTTGGILLLAKEVWPKLCGAEAATATVADKILSAIIAALLLQAGKFLFDMRKAQVPEKMIERLFLWSFRHKVPSGLPARAGDDPARLAFESVYNPSFVVPGKRSIQGWGLRASCRRVLLIKSHVKPR